MSVLKDKLVVENTNRLSSYFPARTNDSADAYDWGLAQALFVRDLYRKMPITGGLESYIKAAEKVFADCLDDDDFWPHIREMYFDGDAIYKLTPESLLFRLEGIKASASQHRLGRLFSSLLQGFRVDMTPHASSNFLDRKVIETLQEEGLKELDKERFRPGAGERAWLPFLTKLFQQDAGFLAKRPEYMLEQLESFLKLYGYLYTAQLTLNIQGWAAGKPVARPLYFIMEHEVASKERAMLTQYGHKKVFENLHYIFPYLVANEALQRLGEDTGNRLRPLWQLNERLEEKDIQQLQDFAFEFARKREYEMPDVPEEADATWWLGTILKLYSTQFEKKHSRESANKKFVKSAEDNLCGTFVRSRGRTGKVLVMNQDYLSLLTNLAIGEQDKLRLHELLIAFKARGVYFDKHSQQALIEFYERMGNVERMSDSGDAVYVRKTV